MSESRHSADRLEGRARWLLRVYPAAYRADRGEEIIGTLLEATPPGRDWPLPRETAALIAAGLRARRAANLRQGVAASLRQTAVVGAAVYLVQLPALGLGAVVWAARRGHLHYLFWCYEWLFCALGGLALVLLAAAWSGRRGLAAVTAVAAVITAVSWLVIWKEWDLMVVLADFIGPPAVVFLAFARRRQRPPASLLLLPGLALGAAVADSLVGSSPPLFAAVTARTTLLSPYVTLFSLVTLLVAVCWLVTDVRPLAGLVLAFTASRVVYGFTYGRPMVTVTPAVIALGITASLALACALVWLLRRRTRACPVATSESSWSRPRDR